VPVPRPARSPGSKKVILALVSMYSPAFSSFWALSSAWRTSSTHGLRAVIPLRLHHRQGIEARPERIARITRVSGKPWHGLARVSARVGSGGGTAATPASGSERRARVAVMKDPLSRRTTKSLETPPALIAADAKALATASSSADKIALFRHPFAGRHDVSPVRRENRKTASSGHAPTCASEWAGGICGKPPSSR